MRIVFAGTPEFAATALRAIAGAAPVNGFDIVLVLTQPDRPAGRGLVAAPGAVRQVAQELGLPVATPATLSMRRDAAQAQAGLDALRAARPDVLVVAAYGLILPSAVLALPAGLPDAGCGPVTALNIHASLLPRWRGAAPVARAIEAGDRDTGITIMQMDAGLDTGPMIAAEPVAIGPDDTTATLTARLAAVGARLIVEALAAGARGSSRATPQPAQGATYAHKLDKREAWLDWSQPASLLAARVRAFDPFPVAAARLGDLTLKIWRAHAAEGEPGAAAGSVLGADADGLRFACGRGVLVVTELQRAGGRRLTAAQFLAGTRVPVGARLGAPPA
jgi:methionyl-tRNA formyltransferase